jgi:hypothetical protein
MASETKLERDVADEWEKIHPTPHACHIKIVIWGRSGWPDHIFIGTKGRWKWVEFKEPGEEPTPIQLYIHKLLRSLGQDVEVHDNKEECCASLARMLD